MSWGCGGHAGHPVCQTGSSDRSWTLKQLNRMYPATGANQAGSTGHLCWLPLKHLVGSVHSRQITLYFNEKHPPHFLPSKCFNMLWLGAESLLKIKLLFPGVFLIHFNFIIQHGDVNCVRYNDSSPKPKLYVFMWIIRSLVSKISYKPSD